MGYRFDEAMGLPSWLFWRLALADTRDRVIGQQQAMESASLAFGGYSEEARRDIAQRWERILGQAENQKASSNYGENNPKMDEARKAAWKKLATGMGGRL